MTKDLEEYQISWLVDELTWRENHKNTIMNGFPDTLQKVCQKNNVSPKDCERVKQSAIKRSKYFGNKDLTLFGGYIE